MDNSISEKVKDIFSQIEIAKEKWLVLCMTALHQDLPFNGEELKEYFSKLVEENNYKIFYINNLGINTIYLGYSYDFLEDIEFKYIAEFIITKEVNFSFKIDYSLPLVDTEGYILKTTLRF